MILGSFYLFVLDHGSNIFYTHNGNVNGGGSSDNVEVTTGLFEWIRYHSPMFWAISAVSLITSFGTVAALPFIIARIPDDYFIRPVSSLPRRGSTSPVRLLYLIVKNLVGIVFIIAGVIMLFIPGQGILTILIGIMLMNFSGKRLLALRIIRRPTVIRAINWMRIRSQRPPLILPRAHSVRSN